MHIKKIDRTKYKFGIFTLNQTSSSSESSYPLAVKLTTSECLLALFIITRYFNWLKTKMKIYDLKSTFKKFFKYTEN